MGTDLNLKIGADTKEAEKSLESFRKNASDNLSGIEKSFGSLKLAAVAAVAAFATKGVFDFLKGGIADAAEAELVFTKMSKALELSGNMAPGVAETFSLLSTNIEKVTGISEEAIQGQVALAQTFGLTNAETQKLIIAAVELSAATGDDLSSSVSKLGNTLNGTLGQLKKTVPGLQELDEKALKAGGAIDYVIGRLGGTAAKNLDTFSGAVDQLSIAFSKIPEAFGKAVIENEPLRKAIEVVTAAFYTMAGIVTQSQGSLSSLVTVGLDPLMGSLSAAVRIFGFFNNAINGIQLTAASLGKVFLEIIAFATKVDAMVAKATGTAESYATAVAAADEAKTAAKEYTDALKLMNDQIIKEKKDFQDLNDSILNYKTVTSGAVKTITALAVAETGANKARGDTAKGLATLSKAYETLYQKVISESLNASEKEMANYASNLKEFNRLNKERVFSTQQMHVLGEAIERTHQNNLKEIAIKAAEERKKAIELVLNETTLFQKIKLVLDENTAADLKASIKKSLGTTAAEVGATAIGSVANGAQGADAVSGMLQSFISKIPWIGGMISELVKLAGMAPDKNKEAIQGFTKGIPELMSNINQNMGSLTDILNEVIGPVIEKVLTSSGLGNMFMNWMKNIIKLPELIGTIATGVYKGMKQAGNEIAVSVRKGVGDVKLEMGRFSENVRTTFGTLLEQIRAIKNFIEHNPMIDEMKTWKDGFQRFFVVVEFMSTMVTSIGGILISIRDSFVTIGASIGEAFTGIGEKLTDGFLQIRDGFTSLFQGIWDSIKELPNTIKTAFSDFWVNLKTSIGDVFKSFFEGFTHFGGVLQSILDKFNGGGALSGSSGSGGSNPLSKLIPKFATGLTEVPSGFPNDSYLARLQTGERVVDSSANADLKAFLANAKSGGLNSGEAITLLRQMATQSAPAVVNVVIDKKVLGSTILDMNRRNERING